MRTATGRAAAPPSSSRSLDGARGAGAGARGAAGRDGADAVAPRSSAPVLLVEDHADTAQTLSTLLRAAGWTVVSVETASAALEVARNTRLCLVVSDLSLPDGDGCDLLPLLHQLDPSLPAIAMTGHGMDADISRTRRQAMRVTSSSRSRSPRCWKRCASSSILTAPVRPRRRHLT
jgi:CheY-like chemotaxis protein